MKVGHRRIVCNKNCNKYGFPGGSAVKNPPANAGDPGLSPRLGRSSGGGIGNPVQYSCLENHSGQRSPVGRPVGYSPWGCEELDMTERLITTQYIESEGLHCCPI